MISFEIRALLALLFCAFPCAAIAQEAPIARVAAAPADQKLDEARALARNEDLWDRSLAWNETDTSFPVVVEHARALLGKDAPRVDVRVPGALQATFNVEKASLGRMLCSVAQLSNCRVWVFFDHLVIAPEPALTGEERAAIQAHRGGDWTLSYAASGAREVWSGRTQVERATMEIVGADIKARLAAKGETAPELMAKRSTSSRESAPFELPFGELSASSQGILRDLWSERVERYSDKDHPAPPLSPELVVGFDDTDDHYLRLLVRGTTLPSYRTQWNVKL